MLEVRHLYKIYKPKKGVPVEALRDVSLKLPDHGMVFLLGKSGSGKSTLLNVLGGLDRYDRGEILIKGVSSKEFRQQHFDSYRNTYVGFIFQEYNVLEEFSVGANIALALELQGRRATDEEISRILEQVDLAGYGSRKPNELSGGQKQRVAIARALVKNPEIIMADEPTGALDSNTGRQVLDTLKKLSTDKLVLVVSHDREFAERYADRIIELSDGVVVNDVEYLPNEQTDAPQGALRYGDRAITVPAGYHLTEEDRLAINAYLDAVANGDVTLHAGERMSARRAVPTDTGRIVEKSGDTFRLIKSKLPLHNAFKIGASSLKHKKIRLVVTILLSCIAFGLFGLADTFGAYDHVKTCTKSLMDSGVTYASVEKNMRHGSGSNTYYYNRGERLSEAELAAIRENTGVEMNGVFVPSGWNLMFDGNYDTTAKFTETDYHIYAPGFNGLSEISEKRLQALGYTLIAGRLPDGARDEIAISRYVCETFFIGGYTDKNAGTGTVYQKITAPEQLVGKTLTFGDRPFTITGIVDTKFDIERYRDLTKAKENETTAEALVNFALANEMSTAKSYSLSSSAMVGEGYIAALRATMPSLKITIGGGLSLANATDDIYLGSPNYLGTLADVKPSDIVWLNGEQKTLGEREIILSADMVVDGDTKYVYDDYVAAEPVDEDEPDDIDAKMRALGTLSCTKYLYDSDSPGKAVEGYTVVGYLPSISSAMLCHESLMEGLVDKDGVYRFAVGAMPGERSEIERLVSYCYREDAEVRYEMENAVTYELDMVNDTLKTLSRYFLYIGLGFALFAALMLANFISTSIAYKKQEIGILRAIGSRSNDVFRIFFAESFVIAMINFVLSSIGVGVVTAVINHIIRTRGGVLITVLSFGVRQIALLLVVSLAVAALASFFPVRRIASKRPIDAIRNR